MATIYSHIEFAKRGFSKRIMSGQKEPHNFEFYKSGKHLDYIARKSAVWVQDDAMDKNTLKAEFKQSGLSMQDWINSRTAEKMKSEKSGVYRLFGNGEDIDIKKEKELLSNLSNKQVVWEMIINPGDFGIENFLVDKFEWNDLLNKNLKKLLKANKLDAENITGHWAMHANTEYPHIHLSFWETKPQILNANGKLTYKSKGVFNKKTLDNFNEVMANEITFNKQYQELNIFKSSIWEKRKNIRQLTQIAFESDEKLLNDVLNIKNSLLGARNKTYAKTSDDVKKSIWNVFEYVLENNQKFKDEYTEYQNEIQKLKEKDLGTQFNNRLQKEFIEKESKEFESQIGNAIIKLCIDDEIDGQYDSQNILGNYSEYKSRQSNYQSKSDASINKKIDWQWIIKKWEWEANGVHFKNKIEAIKKYRTNVVAKR
ncbi:Hypothetical protein MBVG_2590 [Mycoplasmopsis bovigenitalium 51080]|uniref:Uncharacterized protein n=1 Tax=Mycoplasmopsis bovigenitalium 51080 TaxID=1188235 RepID=N9TUU4_9BACT|nr:relaxase MobL [Mycoplasmopsis bovigenitalium]ENY69889.1 Hypothetical protein MBVG_2590 [Mycoplasmopsis bovigenitalium 51080]